MWSMVFYAAFLIGFIFMIIAIGKNKGRNYWLAGIVTYIVSFLGSWSIGLYLLIFPFVLFAIALAHTFGWVRKRWQNLPFAVAGIVLWYASIHTIDDYWLFLPFAWLL